MCVVLPWFGQIVVPLVNMSESICTYQIFIPLSRVKMTIMCFIRNGDYYNASVRTTLLVCEFLVWNNTVMMHQPPHSPHQVPMWPFSVPKIKIKLTAHCFRSLGEIKNASPRELKIILKIKFQKCFEDWKKCWHKDVTHNRDYFQGDNIDVDE